MDTNDIWQEQFNAIYGKAALRVETYRKGFKVKHRFAHLSPVEQQEKLMNEFECLQTEIEKLSSLEYFDNFNDKEILFNIYFGNFMQYEIDDEENLFKSITLAGKKSFIHGELSSFEEKPAQYSFKDFLDNKMTGSVDELFYVKGEISKETYEQIRKWQSAKLMEVVELEKEVLIKTFKKKYSNSIDPKILIETEIANLDKLFALEENAKDEDVKIRLSFLNGVFIDGEKLKEWKEYLLKFIYGKYDFKFVYPSIISSIKHIHTLGFLEMPISPPAIMVLTLYKYQVWLEGYQKSRDYDKQNQKAIVNIAFEDALYKSAMEAEQRENDFLNSYNPEKISKEEYKKLLQAEYDHLRLEINGFRHLLYYDHEEKPEDLKAMFAFHVYFNQDLDKESLLLTQSLVLKKYVSFIQWELDDVFDQKTMVYMEETYRDINTAELGGLIDKISLNKKKGEDFNKKINGYFVFFQHSTLPIDFILKNVHEEFRDFFLECVKDLSFELDKMPQTQKIIFIHSQLKDLKQREALAKFNNNKKSLSKWSRLLKDYLIIEAEYLHETKGYPLNNTLPELLPSSQRKLSFGYKERDNKKLETIYTDLTRSYNFINDDKTTLRQFVEVFTSKDLTQLSHEIHSGCDTTLFAYIIDKMNSLFKKGLFSVIDNYSLFKSDSGNPLTATNLSKSKNACKSIHKVDIDKFFKQLQ